MSLRMIPTEEVAPAPSAAPAREVAPVRAGAAPSRRPRNRWRLVKRGIIAWLYIIPALGFYAYVVLSPTLQSVWFSLFNWDGVSRATFVGAANYLSFLTDPDIGEALSHTGVLVVFFSLLPIALGLISAALVSRSTVKGSGFFRSVIFIPQVLTSVVIVVIWRQLFSTGGIVNDALTAVGLGGWVQPWLGSFQWTLPVLGLAGTWTAMGMCMLMFVAGTGNIPGELYDAARVDGAGPVREFFSVTLPGLIPQLAVVLTLTLIGALRVFDLVWLTTKGGPGSSSLTPAVLLYNQAFVYGNVGAASAIGVTLAVASLLISLIIVKITDRKSL